MRRLTRCRNCKRTGLHKVIAKRYRLKGFNKRRFWDGKMACVIRPYSRLVTQRECICRYCGRTFLKSSEGIAYSSLVSLNNRRHAKHMALCEKYPYKPFRLEDYLAKKQEENANR